MMARSALYAIYGASGFGREVMPLARAQLRKLGVSLENLVFIDDGAQEEQVVNGHVLMTYEHFLSTPANAKYVNIAIANSTIREKLVSKLLSDGICEWSVLAQDALILDEVVVPEGATLCAQVILTSNIKIGKSFHANIGSYVAHDCLIGDYVTFAPGVKCNGNVIIEDHAYIGTGAILKQGTPDKPLIIGKGAVVGMGAVVTKNVEPGVTVVGNPARPLIKSS